jgi:hypothetical protein
MLTAWHHSLSTDTARTHGSTRYKATVLFQVPLAFLLAMKYFTSHANYVQVRQDGGGAQCLLLLVLLVLPVRWWC